MDTRKQTDRRRFLAWLTGGTLALSALPAQAARTPRAVLIQHSPLAGFQYHHGEAVWPKLREGDALDVIREPKNQHDERAVRVEWRGYKLGYIPRDENTAVAQMLDRAEPLRSHIARLRESTNPWARIILAIELTGP